MGNPDKKPLINEPIEPGDHINGQIQSFLKSIAADTNLSTKRVIIGTAFLPKGQKSAEEKVTCVQNLEQSYQDQFIMIPTGADTPVEPMEIREGDIEPPQPCAVPKYIAGKFYISGSGCISTPFHGISVYLDNPGKDEMDAGINETVISYLPNSEGEMELHAGGVLWIQDFRLDKPTLATITLQGTKNTAQVTPSKHIGIIFQTPDETSVYSAQGDTTVMLSYAPKTETVPDGEMQVFGLNQSPNESPQSTVSCNVGQVKQPVTYSHIPKEMLENFLVISFVVILTVSRKMGTVTRHSEHPKQG